MLAAVRKPATLLLACLALPGWTAAEQRWKIQFFYQKLDSTLELNDIQCPSASRCVAAGVISDKTGHGQGVVLLTNDGGRQWSQVEVKEHPISLFFLNDTTGWMVTDRGIWSTDESGRSWKKLDGAKGLIRVVFLDASHGYATGFPKLVLETTDGGKKWTRLPAAERPPADPQQTAYDCISFSGAHGVIVGNLLPQLDPDRPPIWLDPNLARFRGERQTRAAILETFDAGKTWVGSTLPIVGTLTQLKFAPDGSTVMLVQYQDYFKLPSSVYKTRLGQQGAETIFEERDRAVTDFALLPGGGAILAAVEPPGSTNQVPIPGKLKMLRSSNLKLWEEMDVDYRAVAQRAILAAADARHVWVATDTGMILSLLDTEASIP